VAGSGTLPVEVLAERLMLAIYAYGTNTGIRAVAAGGGHGHTEDEIRYVRRRHLTRDTAHTVAIGIANATFSARQQSLWGEGSTAVASDSIHFRSYDQNIFTEWHSRYGGRGILIYWHVERGSMVVHSQTLRASASEVHAMVEGAIRHGTTMKVEGNYVDTHGQSEIGFGITRLLGFDLLPRIKQINKVRLYRPVADKPDAYPLLGPALTRPIRWDLVEQNYDQMIKYATAIRQGTASTEAILRRFTRSASHPTYQCDAGSRASPTNDLRRPVPPQPGTATGDQRRPQRRRGVQRREVGHRLRQRRRDRLQPPGRAGDDRAVPADPASRTRLPQHPHAPRCPRRRRLDRHTHHRRPTRSHPLFWQHVLPYGEVKLDCRPGSASEPPRQATR